MLATSLRRPDPPCGTTSLAETWVLLSFVTSFLHSSTTRDSGRRTMLFPEIAFPRSSKDKECFRAPEEPFTILQLTTPRPALLVLFRAIRYLPTDSVLSEPVI